jgi:tellurite resistance protein TerC
LVEDSLITSDNLELASWFAVIAVIGTFLVLDLFVFHRHSHTVSVREAAIWSLVWVTLGLGFSGYVYWMYELTRPGFGFEALGEYLAGYVIEYALSMDNVFVFAVLFTYFSVPAAYQHRVLFWGVVGAIVLRAIFIILGAALLKNFHFIIYFFGALLIYSGLKLALAKEEGAHPERNPMLKLVRRLLPMTPDYRGQSFFVRQGGVLMATPLFAVLVAVETTDVIFAIDSIPAIFSVTEEPFIVFASNAFAILGLRSLYFLLADMMSRFVYLKLGLSAVLTFAGLKMMLSETAWKVDTWVALGVIVLAIGLSVVASLIVTRGQGRGPVTEASVEAMRQRH